MQRTDDLKRLEEACQELARSVKWDLQPVDVDEITSLGHRLVEIARQLLHVGDPDSIVVDIPLVTRAVHYLNQAHAIPPMGDNTEWFANMLQAVLEIALPSSSLHGEARRFLRDMLNGIGTFLDESDV